VKELIKRVALEVAKETNFHWDGTLFNFASRFITRIDAERGKSAVAWMDSSGHPKHISYVQSATELRLYGPLKPLFLSPTIPEGYALVRVEPTEAVIDALRENGAEGTRDELASDYKAMLAEAGVQL